MTEAEWLACEDPRRMLRDLCGEGSERKLRMFAVAWAWSQAMRSGTNEPWIWEALEASERFTDETISKEELITVRRPLFDEYERLKETGELNATSLRRVAVHTAWWASYPTIRKQIPQMAAVLGHPTDGVPKEEHVGIIRDIFGNPFRHVTFAAECRTDTARALAAQMYESRDFSAMPILADALQDAGCDNADIFNHCRGLGPHVRGCWVVDLVLGKG